MDVERVQRIPDLVRHARREQRQRGQPFALDRLPSSGALRRIAQNHRIPHRLLHHHGAAFFRRGLQA